MEPNAGVRTGFWLGFGLGVWALTTLAIRLLGQWVFLPSPVVAALLFLLALPVLILLMHWGYRREGIVSQHRPLAAIYACAPSLLLDGFSIAFSGWAYPNLTADAAALAGGWLLWCYGIALFTAIPLRPDLDPI